MNLKTTIDTAVQSMMPDIPNPVKESWQAGLQQIEETGVVARTVKEGTLASDFELNDVNGDAVSLHSLLTEGNVVLKFIRGSWCPFCSMEFKAWKDIASDLGAVGARLVMVTPEADEDARSAFGDAPFTVLIDETQEVGTRFGINFEIPDRLREVHDAFQIDLAKKNASKAWVLPAPALFLIDKAGKVRYRFVNSDYTKRAEPLDVLERAKEIIPGSIAMRGPENKGTGDERSC